MENPNSQELFARYQAGEERAAGEIFDRYVQRLIELARQRISPKLARRIDPEDVVQSAYRSFFLHAREGEFVLKRAGDLWRLLAGITLNKVHSQAERHTAGRRDIGREDDGASADSREQVLIAPPTPEPTPDEVVSVVEQLQRFMAQVGTLERRVLELRLQGETIEQIATAIERSQRTVRRLLESLQRNLEKDLLGE